MKTICSLLIAVCIFIGQPALAIDLQTAKTKGLVGETATGYLAPVKAPSGEVKKLIADINGKRKTQYQKIAERNKTSIKAVEQLAGKKAMQKSGPGSYIKPGGAWQKK